MMLDVILVVFFRGVKVNEPNDLRDNRLLKNFRFTQLFNIRLADAFLVFGSCKYRGTILRADVRPLLVQLRWIVHDREKYLQYLSKRNPRRVVNDLDRFRVSGPARAYLLVLRGVCRSAG